MPLTDIAIRVGKPRDREFKLSDGGGLYLLVKPNGTRLWNLAFRYGGRQKKLSLGAYPGCSLAEARAGREAAKAVLKAGRDPAYEKQVSKRRRAESLATTVRAVGDEWVEKLRRDGLNAVTISKTDWLLGMAYSQVGDRPIADVTAPELLSVLRPIEASGRLETARRLRATLSRLMRYAIATGRAQRDPAADLQGAISAPTVRHHATLIEPRKVGALIRAIRDYDGHASVAAALRLAPLVFVRSAELRGGLWSELDEARAEWRIPAARMKKKRDHVVPLSTQAQAEFARLKAMSGPGGLMFPSVRTVKRPISENTINAALRRLGYTKEEQTGHGFRSLASTMLNEQGWPSDWIERQLGHVEENKVRAAYNAAEWLDDRRRMMQAWSDHLDGLAAVA